MTVRSFFNIYRIPGLILLCCLYLAFSLTLSAQDPDDRFRRLQADTLIHVFETIEVTAERERSAPPPVTYIDVPPETFRGTHADNVYDLMRRTARLEVHDQGQGPGFASNVVMRGFTSDHSSDVLLIIDGVPVNLPAHGHVEGYADWYLVNPAAVSSMRVIHTSASPLYGNFALGGVVELFTAADAERTEASVELNSFGNTGGWLRTGIKRQNSGAFSAVDLRRRNGWRDNSEYTVGNGIIRGWRMMGRGRLEGGIMLYGSEWNSPGFITLADFNRGRTRNAADPHDGGEAYRAITHARYSVPISPSASLHTVLWGQYSDWHMFLNLPSHDHSDHTHDHGHDHHHHGDSPQRYEMDRRSSGGITVELTRFMAGGDVTAGIGGRVDDVMYELGDANAREINSLDLSLDNRHSALGTYIRYRRTLFTRFGIDAGFRVDRLAFGTIDRLDRNIRSDGRTWIFSPKLGLKYMLSDQTVIRGSVSRGFRGAPGTAADPLRSPITAWSYEIGMAYRGTRFDLNTAVFRSDVSNERILDPVTGGITSAGTSIRQGIEASGRYYMTNRIQLFINGTLNDARLSAPFVDAHIDHSHFNTPHPALGKTGSGYAVHSPASTHGTAHAGHSHEESDWVPGVAWYTADAGVEVQLFGLVELTTTGRLYGPFVPIGEPDVWTSYYTVVDVGITAAVFTNMLLKVSVHNVFDKLYPEMRASGYVNPGTPRNIAMGITYTL